MCGNVAINITPNIYESTADSYFASVYLYILCLQTEPRAQICKSRFHISHRRTTKLLRGRANKAANK